MDKAEKDLGIIEHILAYCTEIEQTVTRFGDTFESFETDKIYRNCHHVHPSDWRAGRPPVTRVYSGSF